MIYHLVFTLPQAGEATRFALHGHIIVDFVGQRVLTAWAGRGRLVALDVLVMGLQCVGCGVLAMGEKRGPTGTKGAGTEVGAGAADDGVERRASSGVGDESRSRHTVESRSRHTVESEEGIELQPLMRSIDHQESVPESSAAVDLEVQTNDTAHTEDAEASSADADMLARDGLEALYSGQAILVDICFWTLLRDQYYERRNRALAGRV